MFRSRGIDTKRVVVIPIATVEEFRNQSFKVLDNYKGMVESDRKPMIMVLDSIGNLSTTKEITDVSENKETKDMTKAALTKGVFRVPVSYTHLRAHETN